MVTPVNESFMRFQRRAEAVDARKLVETFVDVGPLMTLLSSTDHQVIYGRRGTGKTHALWSLAEQRREAGDLPIYIDMRTIGSTVGIYNDPALPLSERATRLLQDLIAALHDAILEYGINVISRNKIDDLGRALDKLSEATKGVTVVGSREEETVDTASNKSSHSAGVAVSMTLNPTANAKADKNSEESSQFQSRVKTSGNLRHRVNFGATLDSLSTARSALGMAKIWLLIDEWSVVPLDLQPLLADLLRRAIFPVQGVIVKIAAIEQRSQFKAVSESGYVGIELGADAAADVNLDDFMVFDLQQERAKRFFAQLIFRHFSAVEEVKVPDAVDADTLIQLAFTQINVFDEFVRASEGVPRDAINNLSNAAQKAIDDRITMAHVRAAAREWYQRDKERAATPDARKLLNWIIDAVIGEKRARAFLIRAGVSHRLIDDLFDSRLLHVLKRNISSKDQPGARFDAFKLDYGCYVDLITTAKSPRGLFQSGESDESKFVEVPPDDYRSIRRAILDLEEFDREGVLQHMQ